jgi:hypothetical protein
VTHDPVREKLAFLKRELVRVEALLTSSVERHYASHSGRRYLVTKVAPPPSRKHPWTLEQEALRNRLYHDILALEKTLKPKPRLRVEVKQDPTRPPHDSFGRRAIRRKLKGVRITLPPSRRSAFPDRPNVSLPWGAHSRALAANLCRDALPGEFTGVNKPSGVSVMRHLRPTPKHPRPKVKPKRKPFYKVFRNFK